MSKGLLILQNLSNYLVINNLRKNVRKSGYLARWAVESCFDLLKNRINV